MKVKVKSLSSVPTLYDPMDYSLPGSSVDGIFQARVLEWGTTRVTIFFVPEDNFIGTQPHIHFHIVCSCFHVTRAELNSCNRDLMAFKAKNICHWSE